MFPHSFCQISILFVSCSYVVEVLLDFFHQDLPGVISDEELARFLQLKELDDRPYMFYAVSAYDG
jgi:hypothetical protein